MCANIWTIFLHQTQGAGNQLQLQNVHLRHNGIHTQTQLPMWGITNIPTSSSMLCWLITVVEYYLLIAVHHGIRTSSFGRSDAYNVQGALVSSNSWYSVCVNQVMLQFPVTNLRQDCTFHFVLSLVY